MTINRKHVKVKKKKYKIILEFIGFVFVQIFIYNFALCGLGAEFYQYIPIFIFYNVILSILLTSLLFLFDAKYEKRNIKKYYLNILPVIALLLIILSLLLKPVSPMMVRIDRQEQGTP